MSQELNIKRALLSVSDKTDLVPFARALINAGAEIISTGGTAKQLKEAGIDVIGIDEVTGFPEMMGGRVKTLHPAVHGALLGIRDNDEHMAAMSEHNIKPIDLVCVNLYPFERTLKEDLSRDEAIELIDIGGPSMIRSAAKNHEYVAIVTSPAQYDRVANELKKHEGATTLELRRDLAAAAFSRTAEYDATISAWMCDREAESFPPMLRISQVRQVQLRYGENPHQQAAVYADPAIAVANVVTAKLLNGKALSYNNLNDASAAFELVRELKEVFPDKIGAAVIKHTNPCGAAVSDSAEDAFNKAYDGDSLAAYGGILALNTRLDNQTATKICEGEKFFEVIVATAFDENAAAMLGERWKNVRLLETGDLDSPEHAGSIEFRSIPGGMLIQQQDQALANINKWTHAAGPEADQTQMNTAALLWMASKHLKSNAVAVGSDCKLLGAGAGQMDRVTSARLAIEKAADKLSTANFPIAASDGFFPFSDGPEILINAGVKCIVQPGGSKRDQETIDLCNEKGVTLLLTGVRHFKH